MACQINLLFFPYHNTGGHFIDWSLRYLAGQVSIDATALTSRNWHSNHVPLGSKRLGAVGGFHDTVNIIQQAQHSNKTFENIYVRMLHPNAAAKQLFDKQFEELSIEQQQAVINYTWQDYKDLIHWSQHHHHLTAIFDYCENDLYSIFYNDRCVLDHNENEYEDLTSMMQVYEKTFYTTTSKHFDNNIWDQREKLALIYNFPKPIKNFCQLFDPHLPHYYYNTDDVWNNLYAVVQEILSVGHHNLAEQNVTRWWEIYNQWRTVHDPWFSRHLDRIVDAIINNRFLSLKRFNMNFYKEMIIQHELIVKHNLNLKTYNLVKFPNNTQDIHKLLEPNIHKL